MIMSIALRFIPTLIEETAKSCLPSGPGVPTLKAAT